MKVIVHFLSEIFERVRVKISLAVCPETHSFLVIYYTKFWFTDTGPNGLRSNDPGSNDLGSNNLGPNDIWDGLSDKWSKNRQRVK